MTLEMEYQKVFQTVCGHRTKASCHLQHRSNHNSPGLTDQVHNSPTSVAHSTGPIAPPTPAASLVPRGLPSSNWQPSSTASSAPPFSSVAGTPSASCTSTPTHTEHHFTHSTLSSPVSFDSTSHSSIGHHNDILGASIADGNNCYVPIANHNLDHHRTRNHNHPHPHDLNHPFLLQGLSSSSPPYATNIDNNFDANFAAVNNTATMHPPTGIVIQDGDMDNVAYYCLDRGNGQFTPLIPLDQLPVDILGLPARVASDENMIILPEPRLPGDVANNQALAMLVDLAVTPPTSPHNGGGPADHIQSRIDDIIAHAPNRQNTLILVRNGKNNGLGAASTGSNVLVTATMASCGKREKIYCDKWIHDGTCAFTQQGCKFKHEMPTDRETQQSLGLFHGYPAWWKKKCAEEGMPVDDHHQHTVHVGGGGNGSGHDNGNGNALGFRSIVGRLSAGPAPIPATMAATSAITTVGGGGAGAGGHHHNVDAIGNTSLALASNNWRQRAEAALGSQSPESFGSPTATTTLSAGSGGSGGASRTPWQPRSRAVGGNVNQGRGTTVARYSMPHFAQPNFGPIAPPSQTAVGFNTPGRGGARRRSSSSTTTTNNNTGTTDQVANRVIKNKGAATAATAAATAASLSRGSMRYGHAGAEDNTDEMGNASGVKF